MLLYVDQDPYAKWSMIGSLISAGATVLGVILAGLAGFVAYRLLKVESERDRRADVNLRRQQASAIGLWETDQRHWTLANLSQLPIYNVDVGTCTPGTKETGIVEVDFTSAVMDDDNFPGFIAPGASVSFRVSKDVRYAVDHRDAVFPLPASVVFTDNAGVRWLRHAAKMVEFADLKPEERDLFLEAGMKSFIARQSRHNDGTS